MRTTRTIWFSFWLLACVPTLLLAKGETVRITIQGPGLVPPIEVSDPSTVKNFRVWTGTGKSSNESQGLIIDWSRGFSERPPRNLRVYTVSFYANLPKEKLVYVVLYAYDGSTSEGFVYLPGKGNPSYWLNVSSILHGLEGHWFHAWSAWDSVARPLIKAARQKHEPTSIPAAGALGL
jgi:hypothetical protein